MLRLLLWLVFGISFRHRCINVEVLETQRFDSPWMQLQRNSRYSVTNMGPWWFSSQVVTIVRCKKCGRVRHIRTVVNDPSGEWATFSVNEKKESAKEKKDSPEDSPADSGK